MVNKNDNKEKEVNYARIDASRLNWKTYLWQLTSTFLIVLPVTRLFYKITIKGRKNVPKRRIIVAPNHISYFDPHLSFTAVPRPMTFMAKKELFETKMRDAILSLGAFSVNREKLEIATIRSVKDIFKTKNWNLCIFPQGGIRKDRKIHDIKGGFVAIAKMAKSDILPVGITGTEELKWDIFHRGHIRVNIGTPISWELSEQEIIDQWCAQVSKLTGYENANHIEETAEQPEQPVETK